jgi:hypothetical protein
MSDSNDVQAAMVLSNYMQALVDVAREVQVEVTRPSVLFRPDLRLDGDQWSALLGENLMEGVCGWGATPDEAMRDFDRAWYTQRAPVRQEGEVDGSAP